MSSRRTRAASGRMTATRRTDLSDADDSVVYPESIVKLKVITNAAYSNTDALSADSKRHDREFMDEVSQKLANAMINGTMDTTNNFSQRPPMSPIHHQYHQHHSTQDFGGCHPGYSANQQVDRAYSLRRGSMPAALQPSPHVRRCSVPKWLPPPSVRHIAMNGMENGYGVRVAAAPRAAGLGETVVGVAQTSLYGDIVIGIPYNKRYMFAAQHDISDEAAPPPLPPYRRNVTPSREVMQAYRRASISGAAYSMNNLESAGAMDRLDDARRTPVDEYITVRSRASSVLDGGNRYRSSSERSVPMCNGRDMNGSVYSSRVNYTDELDGSRRHVMPYENIGFVNSVNGSAMASTTSRRPPISEARKKVRDLLCKSKGDARYFD